MSSPLAQTSSPVPKIAPDRLFMSRRRSHVGANVDRDHGKTSSNGQLQAKMMGSNHRDGFFALVIGNPWELLLRDLHAGQEGLSW